MPILADIRQFLSYLVVVITPIATMLTAYATLQSLRLQKARTRARVLFSLKREGDYIVPELKNIGADIAREIHVKTNPPLRVTEDVNKHYAGYARIADTFLTNCIHTLLPGQVITDRPFSLDAFRNQFVSFFTIAVSISYFSGDSKVTYSDSWQIDIAPLTYHSK